MKRIIFAIFLSSFFLFRPFMMEFYGLMYPDDDFDYFAHASSLAFGQFPSYKNEYLMSHALAPERSIGPGLLAAPFVFAFSWLDRVNGSDIIKQRTEQNVQRSWSVFGFIFASVFYFCLSCMLLYWSTEMVVGSSWGAWAVILMVIFQGMPLYAYRRPIFTHVPELFLQSVFVYAFIRNEMSDGRWVKQWWGFVLIGLVAGLVALTRYNNVLFTLIWPLFFISKDIRKKNWRTALRNSMFIYATVGLLIIIFKLWPENYNHYFTYPGGERELLIRATWQEMIRRFFHVLGGPDWGLVYTTPFLLLGAWGLKFLDIPWKKKYILAILPLLLNFYLINVDGVVGGYYGYRYLIASAFPLFVLPLAFLLKWFDLKLGTWWKWGAVLISFFPVMSMWCWEGNRLVATNIIPMFFGREDWSNATYQLGVWQTFSNWHALGGILYLGGIQYCHYLFYAAKYFSSNKLNPPFEVKTLVQTLIIYSLPFVMAGILKVGSKSLAFLKSFKAKS